MRFFAVGLFFLASFAAAADIPAPREGDVVLRDFTFASGETLPELRLHYRTIGRPRRDAQGVVRNAVLLLHGTTGSGEQYLRPDYMAEMFGPGQPLDASKYFIILRDSIGHGQSSKPSDGLRARFPHYRYSDMILADYRMLTEGLGVNHLRLVMGTSMGGMHVWVWGVTYPEFMDALMPLGALPTQIAGRNRVWRRMVSDAIRADPEWRGGNYTKQPQSLRLAAQMMFFMSSSPALRQNAAPTQAQADETLDAFVESYLEIGDANDVLYAIEASSDYDPGPGLERIKAALLAFNTEDDLINPPELGVLEREIKRVPRGRAIVLPRSSATRGHGSHSVPKLWKPELLRLLAESEP
jgi:homoserine O-acetyltransferase